MLPYFSRYPQELKHLDDFSCSQKIATEGGISISGYNIWGEGDLFEAPEPVMEEPAAVMGLDPMASCGEGVVIQSLAVSDIESSIKSGRILSEVFYECRKDLLAAAKEGNSNETTPKLLLLSDPPPPLGVEAPFPKSVSSCCLDSMEGGGAAPAFLDFPVMDLESVFGMRRAFSEGDIKTLENNDDKNRRIALINSELRKEKLSRYRSKKSRRNFGRKIKYACRKALADNQPRIRGRFAKTEEATRKDFVI
ncbi:hypothetical protein M569_15428 [Genlisea aurea]|uniref:CCT domain-containing protein n=1 Tax=Genlisea aurea TaxID=192259 RepID=S8BXT6_9LAMI|nr:hypothetical protein M569_15428 [Genlisea aurea]